MFSPIHVLRGHITAAPISAWFAATAASAQGHVKGEVPTAKAETACNANDPLTKGVGCQGREGSEWLADISYHSKESAVDCRPVKRQKIWECSIYLNPVIPAKAGIHSAQEKTWVIASKCGHPLLLNAKWIPVFTGMTSRLYSCLLVLFVAGCSLPKTNFSQYPGFAEYYTAHPPRDTLPSAEKQTLLDRYKPRFYLPPGRAGLIDFYRDYIAQGTLFGADGKLISADASWEILNAHKENPGVVFQHRPSRRRVRNAHAVSVCSSIDRRLSCAVRTLLAASSRALSALIRRCYSTSSIDRGQLFLSKRDNARSAKMTPPVWQRAQ